MKLILLSCISSWHHAYISILDVCFIQKTVGMKIKYSKCEFSSSSDTECVRVSGSKVGFLSIYKDNLCKFNALFPNNNKLMLTDQTDFAIICLFSGRGIYITYITSSKKYIKQFWSIAERRGNTMFMFMFMCTNVYKIALITRQLSHEVHE